MPPRDSDKVRREVEELLDKLDNFVPEDRLVSKMRSRRKAAAGPNALERAWTSLRRSLTRFTLGHALLAGIVLLIAATVFRQSLGAAATPLMVVGIVLAAGAFLLSIIGGDSRRTLAGGHQEKRWRGQVIDYSEPSPTSRLREWLRGRRRR
ncbi:MAG TPA: hypothetical protein VEZ14_03615 [Dehalococcoidia bacterium]|nr:hypothetical protein [Dehalococcoidia bacterium]